MNRRFLYAGLPVMWDIREEDKAAWAEDFAGLLVGQRHVVIAESVFMAKEIHWQFGVRVPAMRVLGLHAKATYAPLRNDSVLVSRFGTSGALSECMFQGYADANSAWFPLKFIQMEAVLFEEHLAITKTQAYGEAKEWREHVQEIKVPNMPYNKLARHRAAVCMPYDTTIFLFNEIYSTNMPVFVPRDLWKWLIGLHTAPSMEFRRDWESSDPSQIHGPGLPHDAVSQSSPFYASVHQPMGVQQAVDWARYSDWAMLPHVRYFLGVPDLFLQLLDAEALHETSAKMRVFNDEELTTALENWRNVAHRLLHAARSGV
ncbi:unnamed protein product [Polarella glacialis]|uniref:Uncharacterized protein n=1 Tax=Polarella glacialis TaxID=89957 RepID=A0A813M0B0_POLGL|nr:unnamed protein product [Polarella glacialis]